MPYFQIPKYCKLLATPQRYASSSYTMNIFDRNLKRMHRERAARLPSPEVYEYLRDESGYNTADRICDIKREFNLLLDLGCGRGYVSPYVTKDVVKAVVQCDLSQTWMEQSKICEEVPTIKIIADEELVPFRDNLFDIVVSSLSLHWINDIPGCLRRIINCLVNDAPFLGSMFCGDSLYELRSSLQMAELKVEGGFGPHVSPFMTPQDIGGLLQNVGFTLVTMDCDEIIMNYPTIYELMHDLRGMAETNCSHKRKQTLRKGTINIAADYYKTKYGNSDGSIPATYQIVNFIGWKPHPNQKGPAKRGSGTVSIKDLDKLDKIMKSKNLNNTEKNSR